MGRGNLETEKKIVYFAQHESVKIITKKTLLSK